jgi:hypothetical protein
MNKVKNILIAWLLLLCPISFSQSFEFGFQTGIGIYNMESLKILNSAVFESLAFQARVISDYPPYFYYNPALLMSFKKFKVGGQASFYSTGSRISSKDYSGEYLFDTKTHCIAPGVYIDYLLFTISNRYKLSLFSEGGITFSSLDLEEHLTVNNQNLSNSSYSFKSQNYCVEPGIKFRRGIYKFISLELNTSYFFQFGKKVFESDKGEILNDGKSAIGPDWSGLRFGISILLTTPGD